MAHHHQHSDSSENGGDSDLDAPEAISLSHSKKHIQRLETTRKNAEIAERQSKREKNRERDRKLKERAERNKGGGGVKDGVNGKGEVGEGNGKSRGDEGDDDELKAMMERAMKEAQEEEGEEEEAEGEQFDDFEGISVDGSEEDGSTDNDDSSEEENDEDESEPDEEGEEDGAVHEKPPKSQKARFNPDHLPDELFTAAFASKPKRKTLGDHNETEKRDAISRPSKRRKSLNIQKDILVGSRAIRMLPNSTQPSAPATLPSRKIKKFLDRTLAFKGGKQRTKGWERRPVNIGILRRDGPPVKFVRNS